MRTSHAIAIWLFELLDVDVALSGDLLEERARGRSAIWYWRQVLITVWIGVWGAIRDHKLLTLRAVAAGFAVEYVFILLWKFQGPDLPLFSMASWIVNLSLVLLTQMATGWVVARTHRARQFPVVFVYLICFLLWIVVPQLSWVRTMLVDWDRIDPRARPALAYFVLMIFLTTVGILLGGVLARPKKGLARL